MCRTLERVLRGNFWRVFGSKFIVRRSVKEVKEREGIYRKMGRRLMYS